MWVSRFLVVTILLVALVCSSPNWVDARQWNPIPSDQATEYTQILDNRSTEEKVMIYWVAPETVNDCPAEIEIKAESKSSKSDSQNGGVDKGSDKINNNKGKSDNKGKSSKSNSQNGGGDKGSDKNNNNKGKSDNKGKSSNSGKSGNKGGQGKSK